MRNAVLFGVATLVLFGSMAVARAATEAPAGSGYPVGVGAGFRDRPDAPRLVVIPPGSFLMGSTEAETTRAGRSAETAAFERPQHRVAVRSALAVGAALVTRREFAAFVAATQRPMAQGCMVLDGGTWQLQAQRSHADPAFAQTDDDPAVCVAVEDAEAYAAWLSQTTGHRYRLLHEAEWEYAARAGSTGSRWWSQGEGQLDDKGDAEQAALCAHVNGADRSYHAVLPSDAHANTACDDRYAHSNPAGAFAANPFGLYDMLGNVWQWTADCFVPNYQDAPVDAAAAPPPGAECTRRAIRGGSWHNGPDALRSAARFWLPVTMRSSSLGFRVVRLPDTAP